MRSSVPQMPVFTGGRPCSDPRRPLFMETPSRQPINPRHLWVVTKEAERLHPDVIRGSIALVIVEGIILCAVVGVRIDPVHGFVLDGISA